MNQVPAKHTFRDVAIADHGGGGKLMPQTFGDVVSFSEIMARSQHAIPKHLRDVPGACMAVTMQALRWELDPFLVASKSYNVKDIISYEAQLIAAVVHTRAPLKSRPNYTYTGEGTDRRCAVSALFDDDIERSYESPRIGDIAVKNSPLWKADPDQQLAYYSIRAFARRYCPEVILGVYTPEEAEQFRGPDNARDVTPRPSLSERLAAGQSGEAQGFSTQHVINEIDGKPSNSSQESAPETDEPATDPQQLPVQAVAGDNSGGEEPQSAERPTLPQGWEIAYAGALRRAQRKESLSKYAAQFWNQYGGWDKHEDGPDGETAKAIFNAFNEHFGNSEVIEDQLRELI